jgi:hypothetical protein
MKAFEISSLRGHSCLATVHRQYNGQKEHTMAPRKRYAKKQAKARQRRRLHAHERLERDRRQAQRAAEALHHALADLGLPANLVVELEGRLRSQQKLLGKIVGMMFPPLFGCRTLTELCRVRGWDKHWPSRLLGALPKRSWLKRLRRLGLEVVEPLWRHVARQSPATQSRWQWTWVVDDSVVKKYGEQLGLVGTWWSGQHKRVLTGIEGLLLVVVIGEGRLVVPVDFVLRRPDPVGPGAPCRDKLTWARMMLDERLAALARRGVALPPPLVVADSWCGDSKLMHHVGHTHQGTLLVEGKQSSVFTLSDGRQVKGQDLLQGQGWPWRQHPWEPHVRYVRLRATSPTSGQVTVVIVDEPNQDRFSLLCQETERSAPPLIHRWRRRNWIELVFRTLKHLLATEACQVQSEDAYYGHLVLRLMASFVLFYTSRAVCKGRLTMEEIIFSLKHYWRFVDLAALELQALSSGTSEQAA